MEQENETVNSFMRLNKILEQQRQIVIYGAGDYGKKLMDYLFSTNEAHCIKGVVVTELGGESEYRGIAIHEAADYLDWQKDCFILVAVSLKYQKEIVHILRQYGNPFCCVSERLYVNISKRLTTTRAYVPYQGIDFLCPGFGKCGTTSLHRALNAMDSIYLSERKENHFLQWCDEVDDPEEVLIENFYDNIMEGQKVGMIDPTYAWDAERTYKYFGGKMKIIFLLRNPVDGAFSGFKMAARQGRAELEAAYQKNGGMFSAEIFEEHFKRDKGRFLFIDWIKQFEKFYPKEQLKIVILEELTAQPQAVMNDILDFIGTSERYKDEKMPLANEGGFVMADLEGYRLAKQRLAMQVADWNTFLYNAKKEHSDGNLKTELEERFARAPKIYNVIMPAELRKKTEMYYDNSVRELEEWLNRDLSQIWF